MIHSLMPLKLVRGDLEHPTCEEYTRIVVIHYSMLLKLVHGDLERPICEKYTRIVAF